VSSEDEAIEAIGAMRELLDIEDLLILEVPIELRRSD
jgi:hypothetical protein